MFGDLGMGGFLLGICGGRLRKLCRNWRRSSPRRQGDWWLFGLWKRKRMTLRIMKQDDDETNTVGCCTLKVENVTCVPPNKLQIQSDISILWRLSCLSIKQLENSKQLKKSDGKKKAGGDDLFDMLGTKLQLRKIIKVMLHPFEVTYEPDFFRDLFHYCDVLASFQFQHNRYQLQMIMS